MEANRVPSGRVVDVPSFDEACGIDDEVEGTLVGVESV